MLNVESTHAMCGIDCTHSVWEGIGLVTTVWVICLNCYG